MHPAAVWNEVEEEKEGGGKGEIRWTLEGGAHTAGVHSVRVEGGKKSEVTRGRVVEGNREGGKRLETLQGEEEEPLGKKCGWRAAGISRLMIDKII